ncbi:putative quinol monooxygenase [Myceligenerans xiligouense]|uniref:Quinol monooxygenase YgiN n=1 Tax=Myceligenerans xiligouense TaxID=253184 RepID=A0A3N4YHB6_9MICO|nr:antibiotic biosynthesis monooxygenase [Myceligenerans xiligouense]RPF20499.1 quinol monooxygenase YgiN [Myceligenerans xiligouense]
MTTSPVTYGFAATMTARPGRGDDLIELLLSALDEGNPAASESCVVYLVSRSAADPDVAQVIEGWTSEEDHHRVFASEAAKAIVARFADLLEGDSVYTDLTPAGGKARF